MTGYNSAQLKIMTNDYTGRIDKLNEKLDFSVSEEKQ